MTTENMNLNDREWKEFNLFDVLLFKAGKGTIGRENKSLDKKYYIISASSENNGISGSCDIYNFEGNCLTFSKNGACCDVFYQPKPFYGTSDVFVVTLNNYKMNVYIAMFLKPLLEKYKEKFGWGNKPILARMENLKISLPITLDGQPDYDFMEKYIKSLPFSKAIEL